MPDRKVYERTPDGVTYFEADGRKFSTVKKQNVDQVYGLNRQMRRAIKKSAVTGKRKSSWALPVANIPMVEYEKMVRANPDLVSPDHETRNKAWLTALRQTSAERIRTVDRGLIPSNAGAHAGSIVLPGRVEKAITKEREDR